MFFEKSISVPEKSFSAEDLLKYVETVLRYSKIQEKRRLGNSNYSWLTSRRHSEPSIEDELGTFRPIVEKLTSESCAAVAVKLQALTEEDTTPSTILVAFENLLEVQYNIQLIENNVKRAKETRTVGKRKTNRVCPELSPPGRQATVSFILN